MTPDDSKVSNPDRTAVRGSSGRDSGLQAEQERPRIICLCGSTRFIETFAVQTWELERQGFIVLGCTLLPQWYCDVPSHFGERTGTKEQCDELHLRKIDLADEVLVLNEGGYIGESTRNEIAYATKTGKPVRYLEPGDERTAVSGCERRDSGLQARIDDLHRGLAVSEGIRQQVEQELKDLREVTRLAKASVK